MTLIHQCDATLKNSTVKCTRWVNSVARGGFQFVKGIGKTPLYTTMCRSPPVFKTDELELGQVKKGPLKWVND